MHTKLSVQLLLPGFAQQFTCHAPVGHVLVICVATTCGLVAGKLGHIVKGLKDCLQCAVLMEGAVPSRNAVILGRSMSLVWACQRGEAFNV